MLKINQYTENLEVVGNLFRIKENYVISPDKITKNNNLKESTLLVEGKEYSVGKSFRFKIWDSDSSIKGFNGNRRNYCKVIPVALQQNPTTLAMADHPEDGLESVRNICGVEKNCQLDSDGWMSYEFFPIGEMGRNIEEIIDKGGFIEMSSSILGEVDDDGYVIPDSVIIERLGDWVWNCSNRLHQYSNQINLKDDEGLTTQISEEGANTIPTPTENNVEIETEETKIVETSSNVNNLRKNNTLEENKNIGEKSMSEKLQETNLKMNVASLIRDANKTEDLSEKRKLLESAHTYAQELPNNDSQVFEIKEAISKTDEELKVLSEKGMKTDELLESIKTLTEEKESLEKEINTLKEDLEKGEKKLKTVSTLYEDKQYLAGETELKKNRRLSKEVCGLKLKSRRQERKIATLLSENKKLASKCLLMEATANSKVSAENFIALKEKNDSLTERNTRLNKNVQRLRNSSLEENKEGKSSRFESIRERMEARRKEGSNEKPTMDESLENNNIPKKTSTVLTEDEKMEKMLAGKL